MSITFIFSTSAIKFGTFCDIKSLFQKSVDKKLQIFNFIFQPVLLYFFSPRHYLKGKFLPIREVSARLGSFCLPVWVIVNKTSQMGMMIRQLMMNFLFGLDSNITPFLFPIREVFMLIPLKHGLHQSGISA